MPRLNPECMRSFFEQTILLDKEKNQNLRVFTKCMFMNTHFLNATRYYSTFRFGMKLTDTEAMFFFKSADGSTQSKAFALTLEQAERFFQFVNPSFFDVESRVEEKDKNAKFLHLLNLARGKIGFYTLYASTFYSDLLIEHWEQIIELRCNVSLLRSHRFHSQKSFDKLIVEEIYTTGELKRVFRHSAKELMLSIEYEFREEDNLFEMDAGFDDVESEHGRDYPFVQDKGFGVVENCLLDFGWLLGDTDYVTCIRTIAECCPTLPLLLVTANDEENDVPDGVDDDPGAFIIESIVEKYEMFSAIVEQLKQAPFNSIFDVYRFMYALDGISLVDSDWLDDLKDHGQFRNVQSEQILKDGDVVTELWLGEANEKVSASYFVYVRYPHVVLSDAEMEDEEE